MVLRTSSILLEEDNQKNRIKHNLKYEEQMDFVNEINSNSLTWKADINENFVGLNFFELNEKIGTKNKYKMISNKAQTNKVIEADQNIAKNSKKTNIKLKDPDSLDTKSPKEINKYINHELEDIDEDTLPSNWDWRNVGGINFVVGPYHQGDCGSCYVFSTITSLESRVRILTENKDKTLFSKQFPISCSFYTEGCDGGYPILVAKFFNEFEIIPEECFRYIAKNGDCSSKCDYSKFPKKYKVSKYGYLGGHYGGTNEILMMKELRARGPIPGNILVPASFSYYKKGIYSESQLKKNNMALNKSTMLEKKIDWQKVEHSVTLVGWGEENGVKYWIAMNTWGQNFGEGGFFKILKGENECNVETMGDFFRMKIEERNKK